MRSGFVTLLSVALFISGCGGDPTAEKKDSASPRDNPYELTSEFVKKGKQHFEKSCALCHGSPGTGDGIAAETLKKLPASYHTAKLRKASDRYLYNVIRNGSDMMPAFGTSLSDEEMWAIVAYIRDLQSRNPF